MSPSVWLIDSLPPCCAPINTFTIRSCSFSLSFWQSVLARLILWHYPLIKRCISNRQIRKQTKRIRRTTESFHVSWTRETSCAGGGVRKHDDRWSALWKGKLISFRPFFFQVIKTFLIELTVSLPSVEIELHAIYINNCWIEIVY